MTQAKSGAKSTQTRSININIRARTAQRDKIDRAAEALGKTRSDFMLEAACREAETVLLDKCYFDLDEKSFNAVLKFLDNPPKKNPGLDKLMKSKSPWKTK